MSGAAKFENETNICIDIVSRNYVEQTLSANHYTIRHSLKFEKRFSLQQRQRSEQHSKKTKKLEKRKRRLLISMNNEFIYNRKNYTTIRVLFLNLYTHK